MPTACRDCGALLSLPPLPPRATAVCLRCHTPIQATAGRTPGAALACSIAVLLLLVPIDTLPLLRAQFLGQRSTGSLAAGVAQLWHHGWIVLAGLSVIFVILLPALRTALLVLVLGSLYLRAPPRWLGPAFRWVVWLNPWSMLDVFLLAVAIGYSYLTVIENLSMRIEPGGYLLLAAGLLSMLAHAALDEHTIWRKIGAEAPDLPREHIVGCGTCGLIQADAGDFARCRRCGARNRRRGREAATRAAALLATAFILLFPANLYPMNLSDLLGVQHTYTNFGYVRQLCERGLWPLGVLTFWTSILTPALMIACVGWCVLSVARGSPRLLALKTRLLRFVAQSGRWSQTGPLSIVFFVPLIRFGRLGAEAAGWGASAFTVMTVLMIAASVTLDPKLLWQPPLQTGGQRPERRRWA